MWSTVFELSAFDLKKSCAEMVSVLINQKNKLMTNNSVFDCLVCP